MGFYIAGESLANRGWTALSLASSLNLVYLGQLVESKGPSNTDVGSTREAANCDLVLQRFRSLGYRFAR